MEKIKLYTEEQVREMLLKQLDSSRLWLDDDLINSLTPIKLSSDKELRKMAKKICDGHQHAMRYNQMLECCFQMSKLLIEQIKQQADGKH